MDTKNLILAIALSLAILLGWQTFIEQPRQAQKQAELERQEQAAGRDPNTIGVPSLPSPDGNQASIAAVPRTRDDVIADTPRIKINTPALSGTINLAGGRFDDLTLLEYRDTIEPGSKQIKLLSPRGSEEPYFAEFGWLTGNGTVSGGGQTLWTANQNELTPASPVVLTTRTDDGLLLTRTIAVDDHFMFTVTDRIQNTGVAPINVSQFGRITRVNEPDTLGFFILHEGPIGILGDTLHEINYDDLEDEPDTPQTFESEGGWLGFTDIYWLTALIPDQDTQIDARFLFDTTGTGAKLYQTDYRGNAIALAPGELAEVTSRFFAGAKVFNTLIDYRENLGIERFEMSIDFGWFFFLTKPLLHVIIFFAEFLGNFGLAILLVTVIIKLFFFPLANKSYRSMSAMKALQPKMQEMREKFADDKQGMQRELMALYRREKVNPVSGCLPIALQIPVFFALYKVLFISIEMRHAPFFGWVQDLSAPDPLNILTLFGAVQWDVPFGLALGAWPILMGITMFLQQKLNPAPADPVQAKIFLLMPVFFTIFLASFPVGLVIYWTWNNLLSITQQYVIMRRMGVAVSGGKTT
ncbi:MAG: membrane protein insertase YidC [Proteobacteria bacterium]|nr:membrane protein insertase YidC [Pseudomonadota bacterium]